MTNFLNNVAKNLAVQKGVESFYSESNNDSRIIYPAIVVNVDDQAGCNRIQARIVSLDKNGQIIEGKDRLISDEDLPLCIPMLPEFVHARPKVGEMVIVISENSADITSPRFYFGPIITSQTKLSAQEFRDSANIFNISSFKNKGIYDGPTLQNQAKQSTILPRQSDVAYQGREDADLIFRKRELELVAGKFKPQSVTEINNDTHCRIQLRQVDSNPNLTGIVTVDRKLNENFVPYSQTNIMGTNINLISNEGKFREFNNNNPEAQANPRIKDFGSLATQLHPAVFGDVLLVLLKLVIQFCLTHVHVPQDKAVSTSLTNELETYLSSGKLNDLISNVVRLS